MEFFHDASVIRVDLLHFGWRSKLKSFFVRRTHKDSFLADFFFLMVYFEFSVIRILSTVIMAIKLILDCSNDGCYCGENSIMRVILCLGLGVGLGLGLAWA